MNIKRPLPASYETRERCARDRLDHLQTIVALEFFVHHMTQEQRAILSRSYPEVYFALMGYVVSPREEG